MQPMSSTSSSKSGTAGHEVRRGEDGLAQHIIWGEVEDIQGRSSDDSPQAQRLVIRRRQVAQAACHAMDVSLGMAASEDPSSGSRHTVEHVSTPSGEGETVASSYVPQNEDHRVWTSRSGTDNSSSQQSCRDEEDKKIIDPNDEVAAANLSVGSKYHASGECRPCLFFHTKVGCQGGSRCDFCHFHHRRKDKPRPCKGKRDRYRKLVGRMQEMMDLHPTMSTQQAFEKVGSKGAGAGAGAGASSSNDADGRGSAAKSARPSDGTQRTVITL